MGETNMKAIVVEQFGGPEVLQVRERPVPQPSAGEVRVRLAAIGVNPVETYIRSGSYGREPQLPYVPGNDGAGVLDAVGEGVDSLQVGERVFVAATRAKRNTGTYAEYVVCDAAAVGCLPESVSRSRRELASGRRVWQRAMPCSSALACSLVKRCSCMARVAV